MTELEIAEIETYIVNPDTPEIDICARWRAETFSVLEASVEQERRALNRFAADQTRQVALIAKRGTVPVGTCLLVPSEIAPNHQVSPWLAGLFVAPEHRRHGAGAVLVRAIEAQAHLRGFARIFLYTISAAGFYQRLGWDLVEHTDWKGFGRTAFMSRTIRSMSPQP
ncbi:GNAT family N-acetyltransferase [Bradyrhizobium sp. CCGUVB23]|uniref:GNAT family N-acetyltransferase n=1 Tax=Bradyrhizobium sp. CCGUVB23 TaxID=2949630 RepID=UPI0020B209BF|nr:GNAT family N-acetyltransferase [Bradyrhizobium sp. CCGUVB23]MCP3465459.1 GNAT family N-acetyltransferase [Bradyrhizobium sp. CCGUVB23]